MKRKSKTITNKDDINYLINITDKDIDRNFFMDNFAEFEGAPARFQPYDIITFPPNSFGPQGNRNKKPFTTTVGIFIFNKFFVEQLIYPITGYINETVDKGFFKSINTKLSRARLEDRIPMPIFKKYLMKTQAIMPYVSILSPSASEKMETSTPVFEKKKREVLKKYQKEIDAGSEIAAEKIEKEVLAFAQEYLEGDPAMDIYNSGARGTFDNNFKNMYVMKGAIKDPDPNKGYDIALSNYMDGVSKDEYAVFAKSLAAGPYARGKRTEIGGYWEKQFVLAFQHVVLLPQGTDCGTKRTWDVVLDKETANGMIYSYMVEGDKLVELTSENMDKYIGKKVKFRYSSLCESKEGYCSKCAGNLFYRLGDLKNLGIASAAIPSVLKNLAMKSFHDSTVQTIDMDINKAFGVK